MSTSCAVSHSLVCVLWMNFKMNFIREKVEKDQAVSQLTILVIPVYLYGVKAAFLSLLV